MLQYSVGHQNSAVTQLHVNLCGYNSLYVLALNRLQFISLLQLYQYLSVTTRDVKQDVRITVFKTNSDENICLFKKK